MKVLTTLQELEEAKRWADSHMPKSAILCLWLKLNLDRPGGIGTSEKAKCYADHWPQPKILAGVDLIHSYHSDNYPMMCTFADLPREESEKLEQFLLELSDQIGVKKIGGVQPQAVNDEWISVSTKVFAKRLGLNASTTIWPCKLFRLTEAERNRLRSREVEAPEGFEFQPLKMSDCEFVNAVWPHRYAGSLKLIERRIRDLPNVGLRETTGEKRLVSFELIHDTIGMMNHLYTAPEFRRRGLATVVELKLAQLLLELDYVPIKTVLQGNVEGEKITDACPWWTYVGDVTWLRFGDRRIAPAYAQESDSGISLTCNGQ